MDLEIALDDPRTDDVRALLVNHLAFALDTTPAEYSFALSVDQLVEPGITFFSARREGAVVGVAALKQVDDLHVELKSMHTRAEDRGCGVGRALLDHLLAHARRRGYRRMSLETGTTDEFAPARRLYSRAGFQACPPFGHYRASDFNTFMTLLL